MLRQTPSSPTEPQAPGDRTPARTLRTRVAVAALVASLVSGGLGAGLAAVFYGHSPSPTASASPSARGGSKNVQITSGSIDTAKVAAEVDPSVVDVTTTLDPLEGGGSGAGTGMIMSRTGQIVTNNHVVQGADTVRVTVPGQGSHPASVVGTDPAADVALLQVAGLSGPPTVRFATSSKATVGTPVVAIGNALGLGGSPTVTDGIISAINRSITAADETGSNQETLHHLLQTDAPIAPGNSGGPLVNASGEVVGMNTAAASSGTSGSSVGFAIPANTVRQVAEELASHKDLPGLVYGRQPFLGVEVVDSSQVGSGLNPFGPFGNPFGFGFGFGPVETTPNGTPGVVVSAVDPNSPAAKAGIGTGDVITAVEGQSTPTTTELSKVIDAHSPGQTVSVTLSTSSGNKTLNVTLGAGPID